MGWIHSVPSATLPRELAQGSAHDSLRTCTGAPRTRARNTCLYPLMTATPPEGARELLYPKMTATPEGAGVSGHRSIVVSDNNADASRDVSEVPRSACSHESERALPSCASRCWVGLLGVVSFGYSNSRLPSGGVAVINGYKRSRHRTSNASCADPCASSRGRGALGTEWIHPTAPPVQATRERRRRRSAHLDVRGRRRRLRVSVHCTKPAPVAHSPGSSSPPLQKLADHKANPLAHDNKGLLRNAPTDATRDNLIAGRVKVLEGQIAKQEGELAKVLELLGGGGK